MTTFFQSLFLIALAPLLMGWVQQLHVSLSNKKGPGLLQPYRVLRKLFIKEPVLAENASWLFRFTPYLYFSSMCVVTALIPVISTKLEVAPLTDVIALVGLFALTRIFFALAAMDIGTAFGSMGARREMLVAFLTEPALLMVFLNIALMHQSTLLTTIAGATLSSPLTLNPSLAFAAVAFFMILLAENARLPIDNPSSHLELTMIHGALCLEYSGRHLALIEWASQLKCLNYFAIASVLFFPWGIDSGIRTASLLFLVKILLMGSGLALFEIITAKLRIFRVPEFLTSAFLLAILGVLTQLLVMR